MVYTPALLLGPGVPVLAEEEEEAEDGGGSGVVATIGKYWSQLTSPGGRQTSAARRGSVDSCDDRDTNSPLSDPDAGLAQEERLLQQEVTRRIERCLTGAKASSLRCQVLLLPRHMTGRVGRDVVRSSAGEPCGLRGAAIGLHVACRDGLRPAGSISPDPSVTPTFELSVIFKADEDDGWPPPLRHLFDTDKVLKLRPEYRLVKRKLYSSASPVIHDFS